MRVSTRWQDYVALLVGIYAFLSPIWTTTTGGATATMIVLGIATALVAIVALVRPAIRAPEEITALLGVLFFVSPWVVRFAGQMPMAWTAWVLGVVAFVVGVWAIPAERAAHDGAHHALAH